MSFLGFAKQFTKAMTPVVTLAGAIGAGQLSNIAYNTLMAPTLAGLLLWFAQFMLVLTVFGTGGYLLFGNDDE